MLSPNLPFILTFRFSYCEHYLGCQPNGQERQCINKCCMEGEICAAYASNDIDDSLNL